jgi:hypothetical protein
MIARSGSGRHAHEWTAAAATNSTVEVLHRIASRWLVRVSCRNVGDGVSALTRQGLPDGTEPRLPILQT